MKSLSNTRVRVATSESADSAASAASVRRLMRLGKDSEKIIERHMVEAIKNLGLLALKYSNATQSGYPDRLVLLPEGRVLWVELKSRGCKPTKLQQLRHAELRRMGHTVEVVDSLDAVAAITERLRHEYNL